MLQRQLRLSSFDRINIHDLMQLGLKKQKTFRHPTAQIIYRNYNTIENKNVRRHIKTRDKLHKSLKNTIPKYR